MSAAPDAGVSPARAAALAALLRVAGEGGRLDDSLARLPELDRLDERDRALANELVTGTVKRRGTIDAVLAVYATAPLSRTRPNVLEVLRLGAFQLLFLDRVPAYAVVDEAVAMVGAHSRRTRGFVNAVLRKVAAGGRDTLAALGSGEWDKAWAVRYSLPTWIVKLLRRELGDEAAGRLFETATAAPERCLRVNTIKTDLRGAAAALAAAGFTTEGVSGLPQALLYDGPSIERSAPFADGLVTPQSRGSQVAGLVAATGAGPGTTLLDLCAAPGTKSAQLAAAAPGVRLTAVDNDGQRVAAMRVNLARLGVDAEVLEADALSLPEGLAGAFDGVLLDAPCSGLGTLASRPDLRWRRRAGDVSRLARVQRALLVAAAACVRPGGVLTYAVCTLPRAETVDVVGSLVACGGWAVEDLGAAWAGLAHPVAGGYLLALPPAGGSTGFFIAQLRRTAAAQAAPGAAR